MSSTIFHFQHKKENHPNLSQICSYEILFQGTQEKVETAVVNEPSVLKPLKVYCICCFDPLCP